MCGIAGFAGHPDPSTACSAVRRMTQSLSRRGPDSEGLKIFGHAALGHRRLAIFDLSAAGNQPMLSADQSVGVVFNGAIYNFPSLRAELAGAGHRFRSNTDTEVLVEGYRAWGIDRLVVQLRGMFAFALWDDRERRLFLVRDRLGVKPLVYAEQDGTIAFASTVRALRIGGFTGDVDAQAVAEFLEFGYVTESRSIYSGVQKVPPASIVEWSDGTSTTRRYWRPPGARPAGSIRFEDAVEETERLLLRAVEMRLFADVPVGALLSGGVDSGLVCWAVSSLGADVTSFTVGTPGHATDESGDAVATARELGIRHQLLTLSDADPVGVDRLVSAYAEPFACESALGMLRLSEAVAASGTKVLLTGDGGDDVFLGYPRHRHLLLVARVARRTPWPARALWRAGRGAVPRGGAMRRAAHFLDYVAGGLPAYLQAHAGLPDFHSRDLLGDRLAGAVVDQRTRAWSPRSAERILEEYLEHDLGAQFVSEYLTKVDGSTMYYALEARAPFFDQELWEFASSLPFQTRLEGGRLKAVLRAIAERRISRRAAEGKKRGFSIPVGDWIAGRWRGAVEARFRDSVLEREGWVRGDAVLRALGGPADTRLRQQLWYLFVLEEWMRLERADAAAPVALAASR